MLPNRIRIPKGTTELLKQVKARTGITPNILARFALALSIENSGNSKVVPTDTDGSELNLATLFGELEHHFEALLKQRYGELNESVCGALISGHIERGAHALRRIKSPVDLLDLL
jgi:DNA sulfur modification protein DndE